MIAQLALIGKNYSDTRQCAADAPFFEVARLQVLLKPFRTTRLAFVLCRHGGRVSTDLPILTPCLECRLLNLELLGQHVGIQISRWYTSHP